MLKLNRVSTNAIRLRLFPFSLRDKARAWLRSLPLGYITTWDELTKVLLAKFFPPSKTASLQNQITLLYLKRKMRLFMKLGSDSRIIYDYALTIVFKEDMTLNNFQWSSKRAQPRRVGGKMELDTISILSSKVDAISQKLESLNVNSVSSSTPSSSYEQLPP